MNNAFDEDRPRSLKYEKVRQERERLLQEQPRIQDLRTFVEHMRRETDQGENIPHFDPLDGGVNAQCLFLFEAAGGKAIRDAKTNGSGFVSRNNDDATAQKFFELNDNVLDRRKTISWNIVPWALRRGNRNYSPKSKDIDKGMKWLAKLLGKLPYLKVVVLCGDKARKATEFSTQSTNISVFHTRRTQAPRP